MVARVRLGLVLLLLPACEATPTPGDDAGTGSMDAGDADDTTAIPTVEGCDLPVEISQAGADPPASTGFIRCNDGEIHRVGAVECQVPVPTGLTCSGQMGSCDTDADCTERPYGTCLFVEGFFAGCTCVYGCATDADCDPGQVCACGGSAPDYPGSTQCVDASCTTLEDCGGTMCALGREVQSCGEFPVLGCRTQIDECAPLGNDCGDNNCLPADGGGSWSCEPPSVC